ncbi:MFS transporter [Herbiconiux daphne]|uniref:MFS transporter n=1 Tax=Herbiconiux daphne TaxID=2970914 RepID=A0ABT2H572_9MICO|nr:MFS transporter [Herbiconiux daphne]MCS5735076.1 MFS transporter [Herbiconiux daphne]
MTTHTEFPSLKAAPILLIALLISVFAVPSQIAGTAVTLPSIAAELGADPGPLQWVVNGFNAAFTLFTLVWGVVGDRIGYKTTFIIGAIISIAASLLSAFAPNLIVLDFARVAAGIAAAALFTSAAAIIGNAFAPGVRAKAFGLLGTVLGIGIAFGPVVAGLLTSALGWRGVFVAFGVAVAASLALSAAIPRIRHERVEGSRLLDFRVLRNPHFLAMTLVPVVQAFGFVTMLTYFPVALSAIWGLDAGAAGLVMLIMTAPVLFLPALGVRLIARHRRISAMTIAYIALGSMLVGNAFLLFVSPSLALGWLVVPLVLLGISMGLPLGFVDGEAMGAVPAHLSGTASGVLNFMRLGGETVAVGGYAAVLAFLVAAQVGDSELADRVASGEPGNAGIYADAFGTTQLLILAIVGVGTLAIALLHGSRVRRERRASAAQQIEDAITAAKSAREHEAGVRRDR